MKILLIRTFQDVGAGGAIPPLGLLYLSSCLKKKFGGNAEIRLFDSYFSPDPEKEAAEAASSFRPFLTAFSSLSCERNLAGRLASAVKKAFPETVTVIGGPYPTFSHEDALKNPDADFAALGEGERTLPELAAALAEKTGPRGIKGLAFRENGGIVSTGPRELVKDLDEIPLPDWELIDFKKYGRVAGWNGYNKFPVYAPILTSRGCPYRCVYCHNMFGKEVRKRSVGNTVSEMLLLRKKYGIREFHVIDDIFNADKARLLAFCSAVKEKLPGSALSFPNGLRADLLDEESLSALKEAGAYKIHFGIESASEKVRSAAKKELSLGAVDKTVKTADSLGITTAGYFMFGLPGETPEDAEETVNYAAASPLDIAYFFRATSYPGTEFYELNGKGAGDYSSFFDVSESVPREKRNELEKLLLRAHVKFYWSFRRLFRLLRKSHDKSGFFKNLPGFLARLILLRLTLELGKK